MARTCVRFSLVLNDKNQFCLWRDYCTQKGFGNLSMMIRCIVNRAIQSDETPIDKALEPVKNALTSLFQLNEAISEGVDMLNMRLAENKENQEHVKVAREILNALSSGEMSLPEIVGRMKHDRVIIKKSLVLLDDLGLLETRRTKTENKDEIGDKNV